MATDDEFHIAGDGKVTESKQISDIVDCHFLFCYSWVVLWFLMMDIAIWTRVEWEEDTWKMQQTNW